MIENLDDIRIKSSHFKSVQIFFTISILGVVGSLEWVL